MSTSDGRYLIHRKGARVWVVPLSENAQVEPIIEQLETGNLPDSIQPLVSIPFWAKRVARILESNGGGWAVVDSSNRGEEKAPELPLSVPPQLSKAFMEEMADLSERYQSALQDPLREVFDETFHQVYNELAQGPVMARVVEEAERSIGSLLGHAIAQHYLETGELPGSLAESYQRVGGSDDHDDRDSDSESESPRFEDPARAELEDSELVIRIRRDSNELLDNGGLRTLARGLTSVRREIARKMGVPISPIRLETVAPEFIINPSLAELTPDKEHLHFLRRGELVCEINFASIESQDRHTRLLLTLSEIMVERCWTWLSFEQTKFLIETAGQRKGFWLDVLEDNDWKVASVRKLLRALLRDQYSIRDMVAILETVIELDPETKMTEVIETVKAVLDLPKGRVQFGIR